MLFLKSINKSLFSNIFLKKNNIRNKFKTSIDAGPTTKEIGTSIKINVINDFIFKLLAILSIGQDLIINTWK